MNSTEKMEMHVEEEKDGSAIAELPEHIESPNREDDHDDNDSGNDDVGNDPEREAIRSARREERNLKKRLQKAKMSE